MPGALHVCASVSTKEVLALALGAPPVTIPYPSIDVGVVNFISTIKRIVSCDRRMHLKTRVYST